MGVGWGGGGGGGYIFKENVVQEVCEGRGGPPFGTLRTEVFLL